MGWTYISKEKNDSFMSMYVNYDFSLGKSRFYYIFGKKFRWPY